MNDYLEFIHTDDLSVLSDKCTAKRCTHFRTIAELYIFAEKLQDLECKKALIQRLCSHILERRQDGKSFAPECSVVRKIYQATAGGDPIRVLLVDVRKTCKITIEQVRDLPNEFLEDLIKSFQASMDTMRPREDNFFNKGAQYYMDKVGGSD